jgi:branched-subunit amino acid transport protein
MTTYSPAAIWVMVGVVGVGTWLLRLSFVALLARVETVPPAVTRILRLIPAAVLAAITAPAITNAGGSFDLGTARFAAGVLAAFVAWRTRNVAATIGVGMVSLWVLQALT